MKKKIFLSIFLSIVCFVSVFAFVGCGESAAKTLTKKFEKLDAVYERYSDTFVVGDVAGLSTKHKVDFGDIINEHVQKNENNFGDLDSLYNVAFAISNDYIEQNYEYVCEYLINEKDISKEVKTKIDALNKSLDAYTNQISTFVSVKKVFQHNVETYEGLIGDNSIQDYLGSFKRSFGKLVEANVKFSTDLAEAVEATKIYELLKGLEGPQKSDIKIVRDFIRAKMLHLFTDFKLTEFANKMDKKTWSSDLEENIAENNAGKIRVTNLDKKLGDQYDSFKEKFVLTKFEYGEDEKGDKDLIAKLLDASKQFMLEAEAYSKALKQFNFNSFAKDYGSDMEKYLKHNKYAEVYMQKMEQFVSFTLPNFMNNVSKLIYN